VEGIADFIDKSVMRGDADAEPFGVGARELRYVVGDVALGTTQQAGMQRIEVVLDRGTGHEMLGRRVTVTSYAKSVPVAIMVGSLAATPGSAREPSAHGVS
jgi:hypothetical protein